MSTVDQLGTMSAEEVRAFAASLIDQVARLSTDNRLKQFKIDQLTHEMAILKRWKFGGRSEQLAGEQKTLFDETLDADLAAIEVELDALRGAPAAEVTKEQPKRMPLPASLPRREIRHEPESTTCGCGCAMKRIGEDVAEKLDYTPGMFSVERHIRGKWVCAKCETLIQAPVPAAVIDKGIPTAGLLAQVLVSKYADHAPLYRQEQMLARAGVAIPRSTLGEWVGVCGVRLHPLVEALRETMLERTVLHADETPVAMLAPGKGKTHKAYIWSYGTTQFDPIKAVVYEFAEGRAGSHAKAFLDGWCGTLVCDDYSGYKALFKDGDVIEAGCMAHAPAQVPRVVGQPQERARGRGAEAFSSALRRRARGPGSRCRAPREAAQIEVPPDRRHAARVADAAPAEGHRRDRDGQGDRLQPQALGRTHPVPDRRCSAHRQQLDREPYPADRARALELAVCRFAEGRAARGCGDEPDPVGAAQRA